MSIRVQIRDYPQRAIALRTESHALVFRHSLSTADAIHNGSLTSIHSTQSRASTDPQGAPRCMVEFGAVGSLDLTDYRTLHPLPVHGTLGLITINNDVFLCVVTGATTVASVRPGETVEKIYAVEFYCLNSTEFDSVANDEPHADTYGQSLSRRELNLEHPCEDLQKLLSNGSFYYSTDFDLTNRLQDRPADAVEFSIDRFDDGFLWNGYMIKPLVKFRSQLVSHEREALDASRILTSAIRGFVLTIAVPMSSAPIRTTKPGVASTLTLISRLSCRRAGTRFNSRGIDDDGNVANFVESETIYWSPSGICFSYVQVRGSVPVFWEQAPGLLPGQQKISITRSKEGTQPAFDKHFQELEQTYGAVHVINLLSETKPGEADLTGLYRYGIRHSYLTQKDGPNSKDHVLLKETEFDFHAETRGPNGYEAASMIRHLIEESADGFAYYLSEEIDDIMDTSGLSKKPQRRSVVVLQQEGVFRTNCLDCLDRTNLIQTIISQMALEAFLSHRGERATSDFWMRHSSLWADNGDALSRIYAGTGALKTSFTRHGKMSLAGAIADARKSATRLYINNFADKSRQNTMDVLLGRLVGQMPVYLYDPINDFVTSELNKRSAEYSSSKVVNIWVGTYNLNGRTNGIDEDLSEWFFPLAGVSEQPEIVVVGFQEIVELSPQQIMNSDPTIKQAWEKSVKRTLNRHAREIGSEEYILLRSGQLVGAALCVFVQNSVLKNIKNVEGSVKKTGMSGMAGNKGAVAIRMEYANTQLCFVTAHLAAGFANYDERNKDYHTISQGLRFQRNRGIDDHDTVIWLGDFNYRIGMSVERVKNLIHMGDLQTLYENDQLNIQMVAGLTFPHYSESRITFMPTYKFDLGTDTYDSSEKARIPAWTDRILRKGSRLRQTAYGSAPLRFSDHRPVFAIFQCTVSIIDETVRKALGREIYAKRRADVSNAIASVRTDDTDDEDVIGYEPIEPGLPPASSDRRKWWLDNSLPARSSVQAPQRGDVPNPDRPSNPFTVTDKPDWITVSQPARMDSFQSTASSLSTSESKTSSITQRKLPPAFDPSTLPTGNTNRPAFTKSNLVAPLPEDARRPSSASSTNSTLKKQAPPIARKPIHLSSSQSTSPNISQGQIPQSRSMTMPSRSTVGIQTEFPPPPKKIAATTTTTGLNGIGNGRGKTPTPSPPARFSTGMTGRGAEPVSIKESGGARLGTASKLPPRPAAAASTPMDLLGERDDGEERLKGWEALQPTF